MLSKEMGVITPFLLMLSFWLLRKRNLQYMTWSMGTQLVALGGYVLARGVVLGSYQTPPTNFALYLPGQYIAFQNPESYEVFFTMTNAFVVYTLLSLGVFPLSGDYSGFPHTTSFQTSTALAFLLFALVFALAGIRLLRGDRAFLYWTLWFLLLLLPVSNFFVTSGILIAERVLYLPSLGISVLLAWAFLQLPQRYLFRECLFILLLCYGISTHLSRASTWKNQKSYYAATLRSTYSGSIAQNGMARSILEDAESTEEDLHKALHLVKSSLDKEKTTTALRTAAEIHDRLQNPRQSLRYWNTLYQLKPEKEDYYREVQRVLMLIADTAKKSNDVHLLNKIHSLGRTIAIKKGDDSDIEFWEGRFVNKNSDPTQ
jgi:hypothetical protein